MPGPVSSGFRCVFHRFCKIFDHFCSFFIAAGNHSTSNSGLCTIMHKCNKKTSKIGTPFYKVHLDFCERVRPMPLIWDRFRIKVIWSAPLPPIALQKVTGHFTTFGHMAARACEKCECLSRIWNHSEHAPLLLLRKTQSYPRTPIQC